MKLSLSFAVASAVLLASSSLAAPPTEASDVTLASQEGVSWIDNSNDYSWYESLVKKWHSVSRNEWPRAASKSGRVGEPNCSHPSRHCLYLKGGAYTTLIERPSWWQSNGKQAKVICERFDEAGRGRGKCSVPNDSLITIQCSGENEEVAFVKLTDKSEFKRFKSNGQTKKLGLIWSTQKQAGGHAEYKSEGKGDDLYADCKKIEKGWDYRVDNNGWNFCDEKDQPSN